MNISEQLFENGYAIKEVLLLDGKIAAVLRNLSAKDQLSLERYMSAVEGSTAFILHTYSVRLLSRTLIEYNEKKIPSQEKALSVIDTLPGAVVDYLVKAQHSFEKETAKVFTGEDIKDTFFETASTDSDSKQPLDQEILEKEEVSAS
ncbi:hypothetical protein H8D85_02530 [bacterium]|nr:hypothetical protein [bacterium]